MGVSRWQISKAGKTYGVLVAERLVLLAVALVNGDGVVVVGVVEGVVGDVLDVSGAAAAGETGAGGGEASKAACAARERG